MATPNNYFGFTHGGTQYGAAATGAAYQATTQTGYAVAPAAAATYGTQRTAGYDQAAAYQAATPGTYANNYLATGAATYDYGYARTAQTYDTSKTYYQQAGAATGYTAPATYETGAAAKVLTGFQAATYAQPARTTIQQSAKPTQYTNQAYVPQTTGYSQTATTANTTPKQATSNTTTYSNYDAALYSAATMYVAQQNNKANTTGPQNSWKNYNKPGIGVGGNNNTNAQQQQQSTAAIGGTNKMTHPMRGMKQAPKPQQLHYCDVCKISCAGPQTYREHLDGQKHKKREALLKSQQDPQKQLGVNCLHCELCDVTCTGNDAYAAHVRGAKHQKVVKLHTKLGKPIPSSDPTPIGKKEDEVQPDEENLDDVKPVGCEYIEEQKDDEGKLISFNCKLCECKFNDPNAKEMHMKGRRHRLQFKKKVQPDLVVDMKPTVRQRKMAEAKAQRAALQEEYWNRRRIDTEIEDDERLYWDERRRYEDEFDYAWRSGANLGANAYGRNRPGPGPMGLSYFGIVPSRRPESSDDRHVVARHAEIYPKEEELRAIQRVVSHTERALKFVSDVMTDSKLNILEDNTVTTLQAVGETNAAAAADVVAATTDNPNNSNPETTIDGGNKESKQNGNNDKNTAANSTSSAAANDANQMISFQKEADTGAVRLLKGVMRVGLLAKGLLLQGDNFVQLVVLCAEKPTTSLLKRVMTELPIQLKRNCEEFKYTVTMAAVEGAVLVTDGTITVKISLTSPLLREQDSNNTTTTEQPVQNSEDLLPREPCLQALAALRHAKWFQARATGLQSCVMVMRIMRDLCQRLPTWNQLNQWALELLIEKVISSSGMPLSPGDCLRRVMEALSSGILINGPGILDPCEKEPIDALKGLTKQQREDITVSSQLFLRFIAFRQIHKVLGMDQLPPPKFIGSKSWRFNRKRRRSVTESADSEGDGKMVKKDEKDEATTSESTPATANTDSTSTANSIEKMDSDSVK